MKDTGIGMDKEFIPKIFEAFSQEDSGKANKFGSTGLGMAISKNIVEMMNGKITVDSEKGVGTTFTVDVTLRTSEREKENYSREEIKLHELKVLVIDDDPIDCRHAKNALEDIGINPDICMSGKDAKDIPIIAMTANAFDEDVQRSLQVGMNAHLSKPVEQEKLFLTLSELIRD